MIRYKGQLYKMSAQIPLGEWSQEIRRPNNFPFQEMETEIGTFVKYNRPDGSRYVKLNPKGKPGIWQDPSEIIGKFFGPDAEKKALEAIEKRIKRSL